jgi:glycosyltransferase involved in cell wall biosynthesis
MQLTLNSGLTNPAFGFGNATLNIYLSLLKLGYDVKYNDLSRDFQIAFTTPQHLHNMFSIRSKRRIGYFAWESSLPLSTTWKDELNFCDEIWVTNKACKTFAREWGYEGEIRVFHHGVNPVYQPKLRKASRIDIVNIGYPAVRKGAVELFEAFADSEYANRDDVSLTFKVYEDVKERAEERFAGVSNVHVVAANFTLEENYSFLKRFNLHVYPSYGEGFGLMPLETMASGMPTIVPRGGWCDYSSIQQPLTFPSFRSSGVIGQEEKLHKYHPGDLYDFRMEDVFDRIKHFEHNIEQEVDMAYDRAFRVHEDYDWVNLVREHFARYDESLDRA